MKSRMVQARRVVVKIGSALLIDSDRGVLHRTWVNALCDDIAAMRKRGQEVVITSSGAIAIGRRGLGVTEVRDSSLVLDVLDHFNQQAPESELHLPYTGIYGIQCNG